MKLTTTNITRGMKRRLNAICALLACTALALTLYSFSEPPAQPQPASPSTDAIVAPLLFPQPPSYQPQTNPPPTPSPIPATPTPQPIEPTPTAVPGSVPPDDASFTQITAGKHHACGLQSDGTTLCWGRNISGSLDIPAGLNFRQISAGLNFTCGLRDDGAIACWGDNGDGQAAPPDGDFDEIAAGRRNACALDDGTLTCWGENFPDGAETIQEIPPLSAIQSGENFTCGLTPDADMACWDSRRKRLAITPGPFTALGAGLTYPCAIRDDSSAFCDRNDWFSQPPSTKFVQISGGWHHTCGITEASDIECWGSGVRAAPGERLSAPEGKFTELAIGWRNSCALRSNGRAVCWHQPDVQNPPELELQEAFGGVRFIWPVELFPLPDGRLAIVDRYGTITAYSDEPAAPPPQTILDLTHKTITTCCDNGVLSAALDPQFENYPFLYVYYKVLSQHAYGENIQGVVGRLARFRVENGQAIRISELIILEATLPIRYDHGGAIRFGPDGMLYLSIGYNIQYDKPQSLDSLLGKVVRIDIRGATPIRPYRIPPDNPFVNDKRARHEIWAYGLRNPWRMGFAPDGRLFIADAGRDDYEEVSLAAAGANLGWPLCEGNLCHEEGWESDAEGLTPPLFTYGRENGCAVIGGLTVPQLNNGFLFGDFCSRKVWLLEQDEQEGWRTRALSQARSPILSFGAGADGTVYVLTYRNSIMRLQLDGEE